MPTSYITITRAKKIVLAHIEQSGPTGVPVERVGRHVSSSLRRDGLIIRRGNVWVSTKH